MVEIEGLDRFIRTMQSISDSLESSVKQVVSQTALQLESDAKRLVPVDTGHLRRSIATSLESGGMSAMVSTNVEYALAVEFGTSRQAAKPYMTPAHARSKTKYIEDMKAALRRLSI
ncbi:HK97 gp10 family phage protein [Planococcus sp. ANT_H30]|uniref:HK97-gp10 family putative phage morphogenesis protein n=1 Tax=Planococcus sp. ANT_H30 TaxID=2597347 RepID=UPI0011EF1FB5|nr:HK97-gp10 family putative phage morphogenesis protein [Planococcus sp. ANT_H30]KAA0957696.1 HK97 gp10 family phage protein [Planococcus sp. ANT_H30]